MITQVDNISKEIEERFNGFERWCTDELRYNDFVNYEERYTELKKGVINMVENLLSPLDKVLINLNEKMKLDTELKQRQIKEMEELKENIKVTIGLIDESKNLIAVKQLMKDKKDGVRSDLPFPNEKITAETLKQLYLVENKTCREIAEEYGMTENGVRGRLKALNLWVKNGSRAHEL